MNDFREYNDYLMHFGILGMKWGVRRYQNPDGTLTTAGKKRYDRLNARANLAEGYAKDLKDMREAHKEGTLKKGPSDKEIQKYSEFAKKQREKAEKYGTKVGEQNFEKENTLKKLNDDYAYVQKSKEGLSDFNRLMKGQLNNEENEYMTDTQKKTLNLVANMFKDTAYEKLVVSMSEKEIERIEKRIDEQLKYFEENGITLKEIEKMRPLYFNNGYVKQVFKQFDITD